jgi:hypothetical protein
MSRRLFLPAMLLVVVSLAGCSKDGTGPSDPNTGGGPVNSDPIPNGSWPNPDGTVPTVQPIDSTVYTPTDTLSANIGDTTRALLFQTSGAARYNIGTCSANGTWTAPNGSKYGPHNPNCLSYRTSGPGNNGKGHCVASPEGYPGLWLNAVGHGTSPYNPKCLERGAPTTTLALSFSVQAELFQATDGSGGSMLNFTSGGVTQAQLIYHGTAEDTTTGAGVLLGTDNASPARTWSIGFSQPALNFTGGATNGDLITALSTTGVEVVACNTAVGCSTITLKIGP